MFRKQVFLNMLHTSSEPNINCQQKTILDLTPQPRRLLQLGLRDESEGFAISLMQGINKPTNYFSFQPFYHSYLYLPLES
jgi:hypothetical protein